MKPTSLKRGQKVQFTCIGGTFTFTFLRRDREVRPARNWFQCDDFRGLNGPDDDGKTPLSDYDVSRKCQPA